MLYYITHSLCKKKKNPPLSWFTLQLTSCLVFPHHFCVYGTFKVVSHFMENLSMYMSKPNSQSGLEYCDAITICRNSHIFGDINRRRHMFLFAWEITNSTILLILQIHVNVNPCARWEHNEKGKFMWFVFFFNYAPIIIFYVCFQGLT